MDKERELRIWKDRVHAAFDPLWQRHRVENPGIDSYYVRFKAYKDLGELLGIKGEVHIRDFTLEQCTRAVVLYAPWKWKEYTSA